MQPGAKAAVAQPSTVALAVGQQTLARAPHRSPQQAAETKTDGEAMGQVSPFYNNSDGYHFSCAKTYFYECTGKACMFLLSVLVLDTTRK